MPPTHLGRSGRHGLGHRYGICEHLSPNHKLSQALTWYRVRNILARSCFAPDDSQPLGALVPVVFVPINELTNYLSDNR